MPYLPTTGFVVGKNPHHPPQTQNHNKKGGNNMKGLRVCEECGEKATICEGCNKPLGAKGYCYAGRNAAVCVKNYHFCSKRCYLLCFDYTLKKTRFEATKT